MDTSNWRTQLSSDTRQKIVNKITDTLKKHEPFSGPEKLHEVKNLALRFEEKIYTTAISHHDYMRKISIKLLNFENKSANTMTNSPQSNSAGNPVNPSDQGSRGMQQVNNQGQPTPAPVPSNLPEAGKQILSQNNHSIIGSSALPPGGAISQSTMPNIASQNLSLQNIQNISVVQQTSVGNSMGQGIRIPSTNFVSQRQIPGSQQQPQNSQHFRYQRQLHQMAKLQQNSSTTSMQSHIHQQKLSQPNHFQPSQQSIMQSTMLQNQPPVLQQSGKPMSQQSVLKIQRPQQLQPSLMGQQNNLSSGQHNNLSAIHQQHLGPQSSQKQQHMLNNQHSVHMLQSTQGQKSQVELQKLLMPQLQTHSGQIQHQLNIKPQTNLSQGDIQQRPPTSGAFQQQNVLDQQKQLLQQQRVKAEASSTSSDSTAQTGNPNCGDWQEEVYQKMKVLKDKYMLELKDLYQKCVAKLRQLDSLPQQQKGEQFEKLKKIKPMLEYCMACLQVPKTNIPPNHKEKLVQVERYIVNFMMMYNRKPGITMQQPLTAPHIDPLHQSQQTQVQPHENQMNSHMQPVNLQHNKVAVLQHNNVCMLQPNSNMLHRQQLKQLQHRDMQQQILHKQQLLNQQHQFHPQTKQLQQNGNQINNGNELKIRQLIETNSESLQQQQQLKSGAPFSSPQIDQQNLLNSVTKSSTPMQSVNSPFIASSPSTPSTAHMPIDAEKVNSCVSSLSNAAGNIEHQATATMLRSQPLAIGTSGISPSPLLAKFTSPDGNYGNGASIEASGKSSTIVEASGKSNTIEDPMEHLLKVVKSISPKSLSASVSDIGSVVSTIDSIAGSAPGNGSRAEVGPDMFAMTQDLLSPKMEARKAKCFNVVSSASSVNDSFNNIDCLAASEVESTATSTTKRRRLETRYPLVEEIRKINQRLVDTMVNISQEDAGPAAASEVGKGTVVKCSFSTVYLGPNLKSQYASAKMPPIQPLQLLVPSNYPNCSPVILDKIPVELSKEYEDLSMKAKWQFSSCVRSLSDWMSLEEMARTWDVCARAVILDYAQQSGGGTFTSKYGAWEDCLTAA